MIYFDNVSKVYSGGNSVAIEGVTFQVAPQEFVSVVGHSGAGKTTLLKMLIVEDAPTSGQVFLSHSTSTVFHARSFRSTDER